MEHTRETLLTLAVQIVSAHVGHNDVGNAEVPNLIAEVYRTLAAIEPAQPGTMPSRPRAIRSGGATTDILTCHECGERMKMLKRHLATVHALTPEAYRQKHALAADEPMVAANYAALRSQLAKASGLGKRPTSIGGKAGRARR